LRILLGGFAVVIGAIGTVVLTIGNESHAGIGLLVAPVILAISLVLFHSLTLRVSRDGVSFAFGPGLIRKKIPLSDIESARAVKNHWYHGWGIKKISGGWLYNVSGFDAVELLHKNGRKTRIGTDEPKNLLAAINSAIENAPKA
jgi:hypothetical protein